MLILCRMQTLYYFGQGNIAKASNQQNCSKQQNLCERKQKLGSKNESDFNHNDCLHINLPNLQEFMHEKRPF